MRSLRTTAALLVVSTSVSCTPAPIDLGPPRRSVESKPFPQKKVLPLRISSILTIGDVQIEEAHGTWRNEKMWHLLAMDRTVSLHVEGIDTDELTRISIRSQRDEGIENEFAVFQKIVSLIIPDDPWFSGEWFPGPIADLKLPATVEHNQYQLTFDVVQNVSVLTISPSPDLSSNQREIVPTPALKDSK
jgi:hypothetical protein